MTSVVSRMILMFKSAGAFVPFLLHCIVCVSFDFVSHKSKILTLHLSFTFSVPCLSPRNLVSSIITFWWER